MKKRLLIIEDEIGIQRSLEDVLEEDYDILFANSGEEAWELIFFFGEYFDLIITDIVLPGMDGLEFLKKLRTVNPWVPAIVMTGHSNHERAIDAANLSISGYIQKPFNIELLQFKIEETFKKHDYLPFFNMIPKLLLDKRPSLFNPLTVQALQNIHKDFHTHFTHSELASKLGVCERHLARVFKKDCGIAPGSYTMRLRMEVAKRLLTETGYPIMKIMECVGLKNNSYFFTSFKRIVGMSPEEYRALNCDNVQH